MMFYLTIFILDLIGSITSTLVFKHRFEGDLSTVFIFLLKTYKNAYFVLRQHLFYFAVGKHL